MTREIEIKGPVNDFALQIIATNYTLLYRQCAEAMPAVPHGSKDYEDIFQDTVLYVSTESATRTLTDENEILQHFRTRFRMLEFQAYKDSRQSKEVTYADYLQAKEEAAAEE